MAPTTSQLVIIVATYENHLIHVPQKCPYMNFAEGYKAEQRKDCQNSRLKNKKGEKQSVESGPTESIQES